MRKQTQQAMKAITEQGRRRVKVISDDTDVFVLLCHFYWALGVTSKLVMEETSEEEKLLISVKPTTFVGRPEKEKFEDLMSPNFPFEG